MSDRRRQHSPVFDQGPRPTCASCAVTAAHEWVQQRLALSVEDAIHHAKGVDPWPNEESTSVQHALDGIALHGQATASAWQYGSPRFPGSPPPASLLPANRKAMPRDISISDERDPDRVLKAIEDGCAILTLYFVADAWESADAFIDLMPGRAVSDLHAVLAVGTATRRQKQSVVIKNSWGPGWGDAGYGYVSIPYLRAYLLSAHILERVA